MPELKIRCGGCGRVVAVTGPVRADPPPLTRAQLAHWSDDWGDDQAGAEVRCPHCGCVLVTAG